MARQILRLLTTAAALVPLSSAILVGSGSPCGVSCGNVLDSTSETDIVCNADDYSTSVGVVFKNCINCEAQSSYVSDVGKPAATDLQAFLYNMRFATSHCLFDFGTNPCITSTACEPLKAALEYENLAPNVTAYGYCSQWNKAQVPKCEACMNAMDGGYILTNFLQVLTGACEQLIKPGSTLPLDGEIFSSTSMVNVTAPTATGSFSAPQTIGPFSYGQLAGVVIGGVVGVLMLLGCCVVINGKRKRKAYLKKRTQLTKNWPASGGGGNAEMFETPVSQKPLRGWGDSPISAVDTEHTFQQYHTPVSPYHHGEQQFPRYFSPYTSQYNSPASAVEPPRTFAWPVEKQQLQQQQQQQQQQQEHGQEIGVAVSPDHDDVVCWGDQKGKARLDDGHDGYELQEGVGSGGGHQQYYPPPPTFPQAPVLNHPGYGRHGNTPPGTAGR